MILIARIVHPGGTGFAVVEGDRFRLLSGSPAEARETGQVVPAAEARLLAPLEPSKIVAVGINYRDHAQESGKPVPPRPLIFLKPASAVIGPGDPIVLPPESEEVDHEAELAVVIARRARRVSPEEAKACVLGLTCFNDVTARDIQRQEGQYTRAKGFDTFAPLGPAIALGAHPGGRRLTCEVNRVRRQSASTDEMIVDPHALVSFISQVMTLLPGDIVATGTPAGVGPLRPGDEVAVEIEGVGRLVNPVQGPTP